MIAGRPRAMFTRNCNGSSNQPSTDPATVSASVAVSNRKWWAALPLAAAALVVGASVTAFVLRFGTEASAPPVVTRLQAAGTPAAESLSNPQLPQIAISHDGRTIAFVGRLPNRNAGHLRASAQRRECHPDSRERVCCVRPGVLARRHVDRLPHAPGIVQSAREWRPLDAARTIRERVRDQQPGDLMER